MKLCDNCMQKLGVSDRPVPVGKDDGSQRDPVQNTLDLCMECSDALVTGDLRVFHDRYNNPHEVSRQK